jgi:hypothetical protein
LITQTGTRCITAVVALIAILSGAGATSFAQHRDDPFTDSQVWTETQISLRLRPDLRLIFIGALRLGRNNSAFINEQAGIGLSRSFGNHLSGAAYYRYINSEPTPDRQAREHRFTFDLTPRALLKWGFAMSDRNRIEWRDINGKVSWRYRNRLQFEHPIGIGERKIAPYIAGEIQCDTRYDTCNRSQAYAGARVPLTKHLSFDGFYMHQWDARTRPGFVHVIGAYWRLEF